MIGNRMLWLIGLCVAMRAVASENCLYFDGFNGESASAPNAAWKASVDAHNCTRRTVVPVASPRLPLLTWSASLAATAQAYANRCVYAHSGAAGLGENIYAAAPWAASEKKALNSWVSEASSYIYSTNGCSGTCGHYTQVVWRKSTNIGCATKNCSINTPFGAKFPKWTLVVCNYSPAGNVNGRLPY
ncbi:MAG: CAP domain-containing protein [Tahibacter sp.]